jgi:hypothetical protein
MNTCNNLIKSGLNKGMICNRPFPCKYHQNKIDKKYENNPKDYKTIMGL